MATKTHIATALFTLAFCVSLFVYAHSYTHREIAHKKTIHQWIPRLYDRVKTRYPDMNGKSVITTVTKVEDWPACRDGIRVSAVGYTNLTLWWFEPVEK